MSTDSLSYSSPLAGTLCEGLGLLSENTTAAFASANAFFYSVARPIPDTAADLRRLVYKAAFNNFHNLQIAFTAAQTLASLNASRQIIEASSLTAFGTYLPAIVGTAALIAISYAITTRAMRPVEDDPRYKSRSQKLSSALQIVTIAQSLALAALTQNRISSLITATSSAYSLYKNNQLSWLTAESRIDFDEKAFDEQKEIFEAQANARAQQNGTTPEEELHKLRETFLSEIESRAQNSFDTEHMVKRVDAAYHSLVIPATPDEDDCAICAEEKTDPVINCPNGHSYCVTCLQCALDSKKDSLVEADQYTRRTVEHFYGELHTHTTHSYTAEIKEDRLPLFSPKEDH